MCSSLVMNSSSVALLSKPMSIRKLPLQTLARNTNHAIDQAQRSRCSSCVRATVLTKRSFASDAPRREKQTSSLTPAQRDYLNSALRVDHAGELAATLIYTAQTPPIVRAHPHLRPLMQKMYDQEAGHFETFNELLAKHRVRPTAMMPVWRFAATALGWGTAVMGREAAMACTEAVETEIGEHYNNQVRVLLQWSNEMEAKGEHVGADIKDLIATLKRIRDEELEHLDHAVEEDAKEAQPYEVLTNVIRGGCRAAIWVSERV